MNPNSQTLTFNHSPESIDKNLFIEAITLCALYQEKDKALTNAVMNFSPKDGQEPSQELLKLCLTYALDLVEAMSNADTIFRGAQRKDLMLPFR